MRIYFDESYDSNHTLLLIGAVFVIGDANAKQLKVEIDKIKKKYNYFNSSGKPLEIKYNKIASPRDLSVAKEVIDLFVRSDKTYFRCYVVGWNAKNIQASGRKDQTTELKKAILYTTVAQKLLYVGINGFKNCVLLYDTLVRCKGDKFEAIIENDFGYSSLKKKGRTGAPSIKIIRDVKSDLELNNTVQMSDLLIGCVLNQNRPASKRKNEARAYLAKHLKLPNLLEKTFAKRSTHTTLTHQDKFSVYYWLT